MSSSAADRFAVPPFALTALIFSGVTLIFGFEDIRDAVLLTFIAPELIGVPPDARSPEDLEPDEREPVYPAPDE